MNAWSRLPVGCVVEGDGEVDALPTLLRRLGEALDPPLVLAASRPIRVHRDRFLIGAGVLPPSPQTAPGLALDRGRDFARHVGLAARQATTEGFLVVLVDSDDGCPGTMGPGLLKAVAAERGDRGALVAFAHREYECWLLAAAESIRGECDLPSDLSPPRGPESVRGAKGWLSRHMHGSRAYSETSDQARLTSVFDMETAYARCRSFRHLCEGVARACRELQWQGQAPWEDGRWSTG